MFPRRQRIMNKSRDILAITNRESKLSISVMSAGSDRGREQRHAPDQSKVSFVGPNILVESLLDSRG
jgi:hypothetical protein